MDFFETVSETLVNAGKVISGKTREAAEIAKLNAKLNQEELKLKKAYQNLGENYYSQIKNDAEADLDSYVEAVDVQKEKVNELKKNLKSAKGMISCPECGSDVHAEDAFCGKCGYSMKREEETKEEASMTEAEAVKTEEVQIVCPSCNAIVDKQLFYCPSCGEKLQ